MRHKRRTGNPTAAAIQAATSLIPLPGAGLVGGLLGNLGGVFQKPASVTEQPIAEQLFTQAMSGNLTAGSALINRGTIKTAGYAELYGPKVAAFQFQHPDWYKKSFDLMTPGKQPGGRAFWSYPQDQVLQAVASFPVMATTPPGSVGKTGAAPSSSGPSLSDINPRVAAAVAGAIVRGLTRTGRRAYYRYDAYGRRRRVSQRVAYSEGFRDEQTGESFSPGQLSSSTSSGVTIQAPEKFSIPTGIGGGSLTGAAGKLAVAGVAIGGLAAGYFIGHALNQYLAGRALGKEQAGVQAALAFRAARQAASAHVGRPLTTAEVRSLGEQYKAGLIQLGYDPVTFTYHRGVVDRFFQGEEEA